MPRYRQTRNQAGEWELIELGPKESPLPRVHLQTRRPSYRSPIDGTAIEGRRADREHMRQHDVVRLGDYGDNDGRAYFERKALERQQYADGSHPELRKEIKQDIVESIQKVEQGYKPTVRKEGDL